MSLVVQEVYMPDGSVKWYVDTVFNAETAIEIPKEIAVEIMALRAKVNKEVE